MEVPSHDAKENDVEEVLDEDEATTEDSSSGSDDHQSDNDGSPVGRKFSFHNLTTFTTTRGNDFLQLSPAFLHGDQKAEEKSR